MSSSSSEPPTAPRPLAALRVQVDSLDGELLELLARRQAVVAEIAELKRASGLPIRDAERERSVLDDRRTRASERGLSTSVVESIFRSLLLADREAMSALKAQVPLDQTPRTVAIIGGKGGMGGRMAQLFQELGHEVLIVDRDTELTAAKAAAMADVVVVSVPIAQTAEVIRSVGPHVRDDALLMDVTSLKQFPLEEMLRTTRASVVGTHPMFGPSVHSLQGQRVVICSGRGEVWEQWLCRQLDARGLVITRSSPEHHDRAMSIVQVLTHFHTQVVGLALARLGMPIEESLEFTSPIYRIELLVTGRHFAQSPELYGPIEMLNPRFAEVSQTFLRAAQDFANALSSKDQPRFSALFEEVRSYFRDFTRVALEQSSFLIDRLVERS